MKKIRRLISFTMTLTLIWSGPGTNGRQNYFGITKRKRKITGVYHELPVCVRGDVTGPF